MSTVQQKQFLTIPGRQPQIQPPAQHEEDRELTDAEKAAREAVIIEGHRFHIEKELKHCDEHRCQAQKILDDATAKGVKLEGLPKVPREFRRGRTVMDWGKYSRKADSHRDSWVTYLNDLNKKIMELTSKTTGNTALTQASDASAKASGTSTSKAAGQVSGSSTSTGKYTSQNRQRSEAGARSGGPELGSQKGKQ